VPGVPKDGELSDVFGEQIGLDKTVPWVQTEIWLWDGTKPTHVDTQHQYKLSCHVMSCPAQSNSTYQTLLHYDMKQKRLIVMDDVLI